MSRRDSGRLHSFVWLLAAALLSLGPSVAHSARLSQVRVGTHEDHTRVVLELDAPAAYRLLPTADGKELRMVLDASSGRRTIPSRSPLVRSVRVEPNGPGASILVGLSEPGVEVSEMILGDPPRIVLDISRRGTGVASAAEPVASATGPAPDALPAPRATREPDPTPAPIASPAGAASGRTSAPVASPRGAASTPAPGMAPTPERATAPGAAGRPAGVASSAPAPSEPKPASSTPVAAASAPKTGEATAETLAPATSKAPSLSDPLPRDVAEATMAGSSTTAPPVPVPPASERAPAVDLARIPPPQTASAPRASEPALPPAAPAPAPGSGQVVVRKGSTPEAPGPAVPRKPGEPARTAPGESDSGSLLGSPVGLAAIGAIVLSLLGLVVVRRRRRAAEEDPLYAVMAAEDAGGDAGAWSVEREEALAEEPSAAGAHGGAWSGRSELRAEPEGTSAAGSFDRGPAAEAGDQLTLGRALLSESANSIFEAEVKGAGGAFGASTQGGADLERRVAELERRLELLVEARERLERQVAAQTEELRVQRAAIARTQRVVRSMSKPEDLATEPVPRPPQV